MKIVVQGSDCDAWWAIISDTGKHVAYSNQTYTRRQDAKRAAIRLAKEIGDSYYYAPFDGIKIEMEDPR